MVFAAGSSTLPGGVIRSHGGLPFARLAALGISPEQVIDFSVNSNPYGPCPAVTEAVRGARFDLYPDTNAVLLKEAVASTYGTNANQVVIGNGAADLLWTIADVLVKPGCPVVICEPTFCEFRAGAEHRGARIWTLNAKAEDAFAVDLSALSQLLITSGARLAYLCNPNSPTGTYCSLSSVCELALAHPTVTLLLDQAFLSLSHAHADDRLDLPPNILVLRSFTKEHAIAGLRLGYAVTTPVLACRLEASRPYWSVNALAQAAGLAACANQAFVEVSREQILSDQKQLVEALTSIGLKPYPSSTLYCLVQTPHAESLHQRLFDRGILIRSCGSYGLPDFLRFAARPIADVDRLIVALQEEMAQC